MKQLELLDISLLNKYDTEKMYKVYDMWPEIAQKSYESEDESIDFGEVDQIIFAGMGGSGAIGDVFSSILSKTKIHVSTVKGYRLPKTVDGNSLVVTTSVSGYTSETLSILEKSKKIPTKIVAFSSGGKIDEYCKNNKVKFRKILVHHSPRASFTAVFYSMLKVLEPILPVEKSDVLQSINELMKLRELISPSNLTETNVALTLAEWISGIPLIYYPWGLQSAAIRFKNSLQENAKTHVMVEEMLEACHNNIVSWERKSDVHPILIEGADDHIKTKERWKILKEYFNDNNIDFREVYSVKGNIISKLIHLIYLLDYTSIFRAVLSHVDPSPVSSIEYIKKKLEV